MAYRNGKIKNIFGLAFSFAALIVTARAQVGDPATLIQERLASQIRLTKATATHDDIVTAGDVVVLHKDGLVMCSSDSNYGASNAYNKGVLQPDGKNRGKNTLVKLIKIGSRLGDDGNWKDAVNNACTQRKFVTGEKFWVTSITAERSGIRVSTFSDSYNNVRYYGEIDFQFPKDLAPSVDDFVKTVSEVMTVTPPEDQAVVTGTTQSSATPTPISVQATSAAAQNTASMPPIPPPPPVPEDAPPPSH